MSNQQRARAKLITLKWGKNSPASPIKYCGSYVPLPPGEVPGFNQDAPQITKALNHSERQFARLEKLMRTGPPQNGPGTFALACTDPAAFRSLAKTILSSTRCLQAGMWRANARRRYRSRVSVHAILSGSTEYKVLRNLDEQVVVHTVPKSDGTGVRKLYDFGPVARGAQDVAARILQLTYSPRPYQFDDLGSGPKVAKALDLCAQGYVCFAEVDIVNFFPSFERKALEEALGALPREATAQIVVAASARLVTPSGSAYPASSRPNARPGIPLGSSASVEVAKWSVAHMPAFDLGDVVLINHVDNFYLFARDAKSLTAATKTLRSAIRGCPGGHFHGKEKQHCEVSSGFKMLGCDIVVDDGRVIAEPSDANLKKLELKFGHLRERATRSLSFAAGSGARLDRFIGVIEYVQMKAFAEAWENAFSVCKDGYTLNVVTEDLAFEIEALRQKYQIQEDEIREARRFIGTFYLDDYWI